MGGGKDGFACGLKAIAEASISDIPYQSLSLLHTDTQRDKYIKLQTFIFSLLHFLCLLLWLLGMTRLPAQAKDSLDTITIKYKGVLANKQQGWISKPWKSSKRHLPALLNCSPRHKHLQLMPKQVCVQLQLPHLQWLLQPEQGFAGVDCDYGHAPQVSLSSGLKDRRGSLGWDSEVCVL